MLLQYSGVELEWPAGSRDGTKEYSLIIQTQGRNLELCLVFWLFGRLGCLACTPSEFFVRVSRELRDFHGEIGNLELTQVCGSERDM
jgi:hypothetical protein